MYRQRDEPSLLRRFADFPLTAMTIAFFVLLFPAGLVAGLSERLLAPSPASDLLGKLVTALVILVSYKLVIRHLGRRKHDDLAGPGSVGQLFAGIVGGTILFALIVAIVAALGVYRVTGPGDSRDLLTSIINDGIFPAVAEEVLFRAILFRWLEEFAGSWVALTISAAIFGFSHMSNPGANLVSTIGIMLEGGILLGGAYMLTRRLWLPMGIHASWNLTQGELFDIPVSGRDVHGLVEAQLSGPELLTGGSFGLEASLVGISIGTLAGVLMVWLAIQRGQLIPPPWARAAI